MAQVLSDQAFPGDPDAFSALDNDLRLRDLSVDETDGTLVEGIKHDHYVAELTEALQRAIDNVEDGNNPQSYSDIDFDRDGTPDTFTTRSVDIAYDSDGDGVAQTVTVGGIDLDNDGVADIVDGPLNGIGAEADMVDLLAPNESSVLTDIAYGDDYSVTLKDDGKLLYRFGAAVKRPNDVRLEVNMDLPDSWTLDEDGNGFADSLEGTNRGAIVTRAELVITHDITNNPNDQVRPEDYENEAAIGRLPAYYIVQDPNDATNTLWVSPVDSHDGRGTFLPSYFKLTEDGEIDLDAGGTAVFSPDGTLVGYRNTDAARTHLSAPCCAIWRWSNRTWRQGSISSPRTCPKGSPRPGTRPSIANPLNGPMTSSRTIRSSTSLKASAAPKRRSWQAIRKTTWCRDRAGA
jgi:hypothetical protein